MNPCVDCGERDILVAWRKPEVVCVGCARRRCGHCQAPLNTSNRNIWSCSDGCGWWVRAQEREL